MLILASASPRRRELLERLSIPFAVTVSGADESVIKERDPARLVAALSRIKAESVAKSRPADTVLGADTVVAYRGEVFGKPKDTADACRMLRLLSGNTHEVFTGVSVVKDGKTATEVCRTAVRFAALTEAEITAYAASGEPLDKAGAYGIQEKGAVLVESIEGDYFNVVGLPLRTVYQMLCACGELPQKGENA